jgi:hypothetical protein
MGEAGQRFAAAFTIERQVEALTTHFERIHADQVT